LPGRTGLSGHRCAIGSAVAMTALGRTRPAAPLTSAPDGLGRLVEEPDRPERVAVVHV